jgi:hypothetical protein
VAILYSYGDFAFGSGSGSATLAPRAMISEVFRKKKKKFQFGQKILNQKKALC